MCYISIVLPLVLLCRREVIVRGFTLYDPISISCANSVSEKVNFMYVSAPISDIGPDYMKEKRDTYFIYFTSSDVVSAFVRYCNG